MLELHNIVKDYAVGDQKVRALKGVSLAFRENELVAVLGQSGCGKTTLLNIIGGLDCYTDGDLVINGRSTKYFKAADWDAYRNRSIGFVFQSYNLIPHLTVLGNVELALTLTGVKKSERTRRAKEALERVGLGKELKKRPNQMSGGQMQRVAIARAIVNNPDIILADEPTGALDSQTSVQVMDILEEIAKDRLVIMVTHNAELAKTYATRTISMLDGEVVGDTAPVTESELAATTGSEPDNTAAEQNSEEGFGESGAEPEKTEETKAQSEAAEQTAAEKKQQEKAHKKAQRRITKANKAAMKHTSMSFLTALGLSSRNLITKKGRTIATSIAGSIGIIGVALVLALSNGFTAYVDNMETQMLASYPVTVAQMTVDVDATMNGAGSQAKLEKYPDGTKLHIKTSSGMTNHYNKITKDYLDYISTEEMQKHVIDVTRGYSMERVILSANLDDGGGGINYTRVELGSNSLLGTSSHVQQLMNNSEYVLSQYDIWGNYPTAANELAVVVGNDNSINLSTLLDIGLKAPDDLDDATFDDLIGQKLKLVSNDAWYTKAEDSTFYSQFAFSSATQEQKRALYEDPRNKELTVVGVMRIKESSALSLYSSGLVYTPALDAEFIADAQKSNVGKAQTENRAVCMVDSIKIPTPMGEYPVNIGGVPFALAVSFLNQELSTRLGITFTADDLYGFALQTVGASDIPTTLNFYPKNFDTKDDMKAYLERYNRGKDKADKIIILDAAEMVTQAVGQMIDIMTYVLIAFAAISLVVSSVMIGIITYASVVERTKEIGVLRAVGARKLDIMRVFNAETVIIGLAAGIIGVLVTLILSFPLSAIFISISEGMVTTNLVSVAWWHVILLIGISVLLTLVAGMLPALSASKRDPVAALRSE